MSRIDVTEKIITTKVSKGLKWSEVAAKVGLSKEWVTAALLGQMQMTKKQAETAAKLFGLVQKTGTSNTRVVVKGGLFADGANPADKVKRNPFNNWFN